MRAPDPRFEKRILLDVLEQMKDPELTARKHEKLAKVVLGAGSTGLVVAFVLALNGIAHPFVAALLAAAAGCATGFGLYLVFTRKQWPITSRYIDLEGVRRRLGEIESPEPPGRESGKRGD